MGHVHAMDQSAIPSFFLYGEPPVAADPDFIHVEDLAARSQPHGWEIKAHKHTDLSHLILISAGGGTIRYEALETPFCAPSLLVVPAGVVHGFSWHDETQGQVLTIARLQLEQMLEAHAELASLFAHPRCIALGGAQCADIAANMASIAREHSWIALGQSAAVLAHLQLVLVSALRQVQQLQDGGAGSLRQSQLLARFRQLVEQRYRLREPVSAYARELAVSETALREACAAAGQSPATIRDRRAVLEAQRLLAFSAMSVAEIGEAVGLDDPAYFSRFFTRNCGISPRRWRQDLRQRGKRAALA